MNNMYIIFVGPPGSGKSLTKDLIKRALQSHGLKPKDVTDAEEVWESTDYKLDVPSPENIIKLKYDQKALKNLLGLNRQVTKNN